MHPLARVLRAAADGRFPAADGAVERLPAWRPGVEAAVALTGHGYLCLADDRPVPGAVAAIAAGAFGGVADPRVVASLAGEAAGPDDIDSLDVILLGSASDAAASQLRPLGGEHPRVEFARRLRDDVLAFVLDDRPDDGVVTLGRGVAGLTEVSVEVAAEHRGHGVGVQLVQSALGLAPRDAPVVAMVAPGNAASLRIFLRAGFVPVGSAQLWHRLPAG